MLLGCRDLTKMTQYPNKFTKAFYRTKETPYDYFVKDYDTNKRIRLYDARQEWLNREPKQGWADFELRAYSE